VYKRQQYNKLVNSGLDYSYDVVQSWHETHNKDSIVLGPARNKTKKWNFVLMQSLYRSYVPLDSLKYYQMRYIDTIKSAGATPVFYDDWYTNNPAITDTVVKVCQATGAYIAPVSSAYRWCQANFPTIHYQVDWVHAAEPLGVLAGYTCWSTLFGEPTFGFNKFYAGLSNDEAHLMQQVAWNFVTLSPYLELQPWAGKVVRLVQAMSFTKKVDTLEQYQSRQLLIVPTFNNDSTGAPCKWAIFTSLDPEIASVSFSGLVMGKNSGMARIVAMREWKYDTLQLYVSPTTLVLDSVRIAPHAVSGYLSNGFAFTATAYLRNQTTPMTIDITRDAQWISGDTTVFTAPCGVITRTSAKGGAQALMLQFGGQGDTVHFTMIPQLRYMSRVKFMNKDTVLNQNWLPDIGSNYSATRGCGFLETKETPSYVKATDWQAITYKDSNFLRSGFVRPRKKVVGIGLVDSWGTYKFNAPDGDYIIKAVIGHYNPTLALPCSLLFVNGTVSDTLATFVSKKTSKLMTIKDTVRVFGEDGLKLRVFGPIEYLVVCTSEGVDIDSVAFDSDAFIKGGALAKPDDSDTGSVVDSVPTLTANPNPFNPVTTLTFRNPSKTAVTLSLFDASGRKVRTLVSETLPSGLHRMNWDGTDALGRAVGSGLYFVRLNIGTQQLIRQILLAR